MNLFCNREGMDKMKKASIVAALCALLLFVGAVGCNGNEPADIGEVSGVSDASRTADSEGSTTQETEDDQAESSSANMPGESNNDEHSNQTPHKPPLKQRHLKRTARCRATKTRYSAAVRACPPKSKGTRFVSWRSRDGLGNMETSSRNWKSAMEPQWNIR